MCPNNHYRSSDMTADRPRLTSTEEVHVKIEEDNELDVLSAVASRAAHDMAIDGPSVLGDRAPVSVERDEARTNSTTAHEAEEEAAVARSGDDRKTPALPGRLRCSSAPVASVDLSHRLPSFESRSMISASLPPLHHGIATTVSPALTTSTLQSHYSGNSDTFTSDHSSLSVRTGRTSPATYARPKETLSQRRPTVSSRRCPSEARLASKSSQEALSTVSAASGYVRSYLVSDRPNFPVIGWSDRIRVWLTEEANLLKTKLEGSASLPQPDSIAVNVSSP